MYLITDIGNTETKIFYFDAKLKIKNKIICKTDLLNSKNFEKKIKSFKKYHLKLNKVIISSVVPKSERILKNIFYKILKKKIYSFKKINLKKFVNIQVNKNQVGSDRIANAIGILNKRDNYIVIDFGTATTFDIIKKKDYLGGVIAPGIKLSLNNLVERASLIPKIKLMRTKKVVGKNTLTAVRSGFFFGYSGLINKIIKVIKKETKTNYKIVLTGGLSYMFKNSLEEKCVVKKDLTINGILKVAQSI